MNFIKRHDIKNPQMAGWGRDSLYKSFALGSLAVVANPNLLASIASQCRQNAISVAVLAGPKEHLLQDLRYSTAFSMAHWAICLDASQRIELKIEGHNYTVGGKAISAYKTMTDWEMAVYIEIILRDQQHFPMLTAAGKACLTEDISSNDASRALEYRYMDALIRNDPESALEITQQLFAQSGQSGTNQAANEFLIMPSTRLWNAILSKDQAAVDKALESALEHHKLFWGNTENSQKIFGWISLPLLAACAYAYDHGMDINVESDYIPRWLVTGDFA
ncbi:MAG: hypothetical protein RLZZ519_3010 [Bacteroidota bacterium]|jgi:hypothetical protein